MRTGHLGCGALIGSDPDESRKDARLAWSWLQGASAWLGRGFSEGCSRGVVRVEGRGEFRGVGESSASGSFEGVRCERERANNLPNHVGLNDEREDRHLCPTGTGEGGDLVDAVDELCPPVGKVVVWVAAGRRLRRRWRARRCGKRSGRGWRRRGRSGRGAFWARESSAFGLLRRNEMLRGSFEGNPSARCG